MKDIDSGMKIYSKASNKYFSTKRFGPISTGHRQYKSDTHCRWVHGYRRIVEIVFWGSELDERGWVVDFGDLRDVKTWLESEWDHRVLIAHDDPHLGLLQMLEEADVINLNVLPPEYGPGIELSCKYVYDKVDQLVKTKTNNRCGVHSVRIWEHENNSAIYGSYPSAE